LNRRRFGARASNASTCIQVWRRVCKSIPRGDRARGRNIHSDAILVKRWPNAVLASHELRVCMHRLSFCFQDMEHCTHSERFKGALTRQILRFAEMPRRGGRAKKARPSRYLSRQRKPGDAGDRWRPSTPWMGSSRPRNHSHGGRLSDCLEFRFNAPI
jgi:hypothetical protein